MSVHYRADPAGGCGLMLILGAIAGASIVGILSFNSFMQLVALITSSLAIIFASGAVLNALRRRRDRRANRLYLNHRYGKGRGDEQMILTIGRIIHVIESSVVDRCIAAIVTGIAYAPPPYGQGQPLTIYMTVFPPHGARDDAARRVVLAQDSPHWHDPRECPLAPLLTNAGGGGSGGIDRVRVAPDHPQDGYAYDGCTCDRCIAIRGAGEA